MSLAELPPLDFETEIGRNRDVRRRNLSIVLACIERNGPLSHTEILAATGLMTATVSTLVSQLLGWGLIVEGEPVATGARGRPRRLVSLAPNAATAVGIDITEDNIAVMIVDATGEMLAEKCLSHRSTDVPTREFGVLIGELVNRISPPGVINGRTVSIAISVPGPVAAGLTTSLARGWHTAPLHDLFTWQPSTTRFTMAVNDGDAAVTAEYLSGIAADHRDVAVIHGSIGIAGGIVTGGRLLQGQAGLQSSLGHIPVEFVDPVQCPCGSRGCFARYVSLAAFAGQLGLEAEYGSSGSGDFAATLRGRALAGDALVLDVLATARERIRRLSHIVGTVTSPELIVLTGNLAGLGEWLEIPDAPQHLGGGTLLNWVSPVVTTRFGTKSALIGVTEIARRAMIIDPERMASTTRA